VSPYSYSWYLNGKIIPEATSSSWTFKPTTVGSYYVYLIVTDSTNKSAQSETARIIVTYSPVGGYAVSFDKHASVRPITTNFAPVIGSTLFLVAYQKQKRRKRENRIHSS
jgi:PKD repeat protein